jgi:hypothetical protein
MRQKQGVRAFGSGDKDSERIFWDDPGVHQNLTFPGAGAAAGCAGGCGRSRGCRRRSRRLRSNEKAKTPEDRMQR